MNETLLKLKDKSMAFWGSKSKKQKLIMGIAVGVSILAIFLTSFFATQTTLEPLYKNLTPSETGTIKESLDSRGINSQISDGGTTIMVPREMVDTLKVELAADGIPKSGSIDYSFFSQNAGFGMTDNEFNVLKLDAMQTELAELMKGIDGVQDAKVMITLPEAGIFVADTGKDASASIVLNTLPGQIFEEKQIAALYHLVSKSVPNLPTDNIVIMNQFFEYFELNNFKKKSIAGSFTEQMDIKQKIERDLQRQVQNMLGTLIGFDKVVVSVTADVDFKQENRKEDLVVPVDEENNEGIALSAQRISETYTGNGDGAIGVPAAEDPADSLGSSYIEGTSGNGDYERVEETINNEVNRIRKEIVESPYKIRDLGIQVMVEPPNPDDLNSLSEESKNDISKILSTIVRTSIDKNVGTDISDEAIQDKIIVSVQRFNGKMEFAEAKISSIPWWIYVIGGILFVVIILLIIMMLRSRKNKEVVLESEPEAVTLPDVNNSQETEGSLRRKQLEKMAKDKPEEFAKLLRTWLAED
ncbi:flagellar basal-body MS-ring/collar protein FliF [Bacillus sp. 2205SS5-2]|uniref:flagellar basal-body MS-ring/collar protein FliF n=1 Tax=Bacillus sp. 2205SS5-2 TaxID=3109031 RepID=UPI0030041AD9